MFERILIANRGEVAARVARSCRRLGVETVAVHIEGEAEEVHVEACDESRSIGASPAAYQDSGALIEAARSAEVQAVHPGYGGLSRDPAFAKALEAEGLVFIGPAADRFESARDRIAVRRAADETGVRLAPGSETALKQVDEILAAAREIEDAEGYRVRPAWGFGDEGVIDADDLDALASILAETTLPEEGVTLESRFDRARYVEVQLAFDGQEAVVLGDRDRSLRRGPVGIVVESPARALDEHPRGDTLRGALWDASLELVTRLGCAGLVSVQFAIDSEGRSYFDRIRFGLSVDHATTEMCTGLDLVELSLELAAGATMPKGASRAEPTGTAVQAVLMAATDPVTGRPFDSRVGHARWPPAPQGKVRIEAGVKPGSVVSSLHDPIVASVTTYAPTRHDAVLVLDRVLAEIHLGPMVTNQRLLRKVLNHESFRAGQYDEGFLERI